MKHKSWKTKFLLSYILAAVIPVLVLGCFFYYGSKLSAGKEIENSNYSALLQALNKVDYVVEKMNGIAYHFSGYEFDEDFMESDRRIQEANEVKLIKQLKTYAENLDSVPTQVILYIRGDKFIYTDQEKMLYSNFENSIKQYGNLSMSSFFKKLNSLSYNTSVKAYQDAEKEQYDKTITFYLYPVPYMESLPTATLGFGFRFQDIYGMLENYLGDMAMDTYIFNEHYQNIFTSEKGGLGPELKLTAEEIAENYKGTGVFERNTADGSYIIMRAVSQNSGFSIVSICRKSSFYAKNESFETALFFVVALLTILGIVQAYYLSRRNYSPIQELLKLMLSSKKGTGLNENSNEFEMIQDCWLDTQNKNEELYALVTRQRPLVVAECLRSLMEGKTQDMLELEAMLYAAHINFSFPDFFVLLLPVSGSSDSEKDNSREVLALVRDCVRTYGHFWGIDIIRDNRIAVIVNCITENPEEDVRVTAGREILHEAKAKGLGELFCYAGRIYPDLTGIATSYLEASAAAAEYKETDGTNLILFEQMMHEDQNSQYPVLEQALYIQCLKQANREAALKALDEMVNVISEIKSFLITQCLCYDIINVIIKTVGQLKGFELKNAEIKELCVFENLEEFRTKGREITVKICDQYAEYKQASGRELKASMLNYVNLHFTDLTMCLADVAEQFELTSNYVSRFFKQETGCSFIQYITMLRMDRAKELLITTEIPIKEIVMQIGYVDVANFVRKFKSCEGLTPGQFRENMKRRS